jgi:hypothetical protein
MLFFPFFLYCANFFSSFREQYLTLINPISDELMAAHRMPNTPSNVKGNITRSLGLMGAEVRRQYKEGRLPPPPPKTTAKKSRQLYGIAPSPFSTPTSPAIRAAPPMGVPHFDSRGIKYTPEQRNEMIAQSMEDEERFERNQPTWADPLFAPPRPNRKR